MFIEEVISSYKNKIEPPITVPSPPSHCHYVSDILRWDVQEGYHGQRAEEEEGLELLTFLCVCGNISYFFCAEIKDITELIVCLRIW